MMKNQETMRKRIFYIDNLRVFLSLLVVAHHWALANGGPGDWYTNESHLGEFGIMILSQFVAVNQAFFMGFFFLISGYMIPGSYDKKGGRIFLKQRLIRLGIPLLFYIVIISPLLNYFSDLYSGNYTGSLLHFIASEKGIFSWGPLWFVWLLLIFGVVYHLFRVSLKTTLASAPRKKIKKVHLVLILLILVALTYTIRIYAPVGYWLPILGFQPAHVCQYILCFVLGIAAYRWNMLDRITYKASWKSFFTAQVLILVIFPAIFLLSGKSDQVDLFMGGGSVYSLLFAFWEQLVALTMIIGLLGIFKQYFNSQSNLLKDLSRNSYAIYVFHGVVLVSVSILVQSFTGNSLIKFLILLLPVLLLCYLMAKLILKIPVVQKVL